MTTFVKFLRAGHTPEGNLMAEVLSDDGKKYPFAITPACFVNLFAGIWKAAADVQPRDEQGEAPFLETKAQFAVANMRPMMALISGPLTILLPLDGEEMTYLQDQTRDFLSSTKGKHSH